MAVITLSAAYGAIEQYEGFLFQIDVEGTAFTEMTGTRLTFVHPLGSTFEGYRVQITGTGFTYDAGGAIDGAMSAVRIFDPSNQQILSITGLAGNPFANDLPQFLSSVFGSQVTPGGVGPGPDGKVAWNQLFSGDDTIIGTDGNDWRGGGALNLGNDLFLMGDGDDHMEGGAGNDTYQGGEGWDWLNYGNTHWIEGIAAYRGIVVDVAAGTVLDPWGGTDSFTDVEEFKGSRYNDLFLGADGQDRFVGLRGRDVFHGGLASFDAAGDRQDWRDQVTYWDDYWYGGTRGIVVRLETSYSAATGSISGTIRDGFGQIDTVHDIERVAGTRFNDIFVGSRAGNHFSGGEGRDRYDGGEGWDLLDLSRWFGEQEVGAIRLDLTRSGNQIQNDGFGNIETVVNVETFIAGIGNDWLRGTFGSQEFVGGAGRDTMAGGADTDWFVWEDASHFGDIDTITDFTATGPQADRLAFDTLSYDGMSGTLTLVIGTRATSAVDTFIFNPSSRILSWDADGTGAGAAVDIVRLQGVSLLSADNFDLWT